MRLSAKAGTAKRGTNAWHIAMNDAYGQAPEAFDFDFQPTIDRLTILELARLDFVRRREDIVITGKAGTGKSHLLKAFALRACEHGIPMRYACCVALHAGLADGSYPARLKSWVRPDLLIIDDIGLGQLKTRDDEPTAVHTLYNRVDRRHGKNLHRRHQQHPPQRLGPLPRRRHPHRRDIDGSEGATPGPRMDLSKAPPKPKSQMPASDTATLCSG